MKKLFFILTASLVFATLLIRAANAASCEGVKFNPQVNFSTSYGKLEYDFSRNREQITNMSAGTVNGESGVFLSGLATVNIEKEAEVGTITETVDNNTICVVPRVVNIYVGLSKPKIHISKDLKPGSCPYNLVMRHEQTHQRINKATLDYFIPSFSDAAEKIAKKLKPIKIASYGEIDRASEELSTQMYNQFEKVVEIFKKELAIEQGKLDNKSNYAAEGNICRQYNAKH